MTSSWNCPQVIDIGSQWWWVYIGSVNGLVVVLTQVYDAKRHNRGQWVNQLNWYLNGLVQERYNSIANALSYVFLHQPSKLCNNKFFKMNGNWGQSTFMNLSFVSPDCDHNRDVTWALWCSYHWQLDCLFNSMFRVTMKKSSNLPIIGLLEQIPLVFGSQKANNVKKCIYVMTSLFFAKNSYVI